MKRALWIVSGCLWILAGVTHAQETEPAPDDTDVSDVSDDRAAPPAIPPQNARNLREAPPRPGVGDFAERAEQLFHAILANDAETVARDAFFPANAFNLVKGVSDPARVYRRLIRELNEHVHALHEEIPAGAEFVRFQLSRRCGWVERRQEANALPYWACRHNWIHYRVGEREARFKVRTVITWGERWFVTHLSS